MLTHDFRIKIIDMGFVKELDYNYQFVESGIVGTENYIAPEILITFDSTNEPCIYDLKTDAFGVGMTMANIFFPTIFDGIFNS